MKTFTIAATVAVVAAFANAAPSLPKAVRQFEAQLTFLGAGPNPPTYSLSVPTDGSTFRISNDLSVSHISSDGGASCTIYGTLGSTTTVVGAETVDVGPPQPQAAGSCLAL